MQESKKNNEKSDIKKNKKNKKIINSVVIAVDSISSNESFVRVAISAFIASLNPTVDELNDVKTAVSEAVTNAIIHGYEDRDIGKIFITCKIKNNEITIEVRDCGTGIDDIATAMTPMYTSKPDQERSGIGFTVMETFMDKVVVKSQKNLGTKIIMTKKFFTGY